MYLSLQDGAILRPWRPRPVLSAQSLGEGRAGANAMGFASGTGGPRGIVGAEVRSVSCLTYVNIYSNSALLCVGIAQLPGKL